jgi:hypothetical protein
MTDKKPKILAIVKNNKESDLSQESVNTPSSSNSPKKNKAKPADKSSVNTGDGAGDRSLSSSPKKTKAKAADKSQVSTEDIVESQSLPNSPKKTKAKATTDKSQVPIEKESESQPLDKNAIKQKKTDLELENTEVKTVKNEKIIPNLTEEEKKIRAAKNWLRKILKLAPEDLVNLLTEQLQSCDGKISDNLLADNCYYRIFISYQQVNRFYKIIGDFVLANPHLVVSIWQVLQDQNLTISQKVVQLNDLGWADFNRKKPGRRRKCFLMVYLLAQLMTSTMPTDKFNSEV